MMLNLEQIRALESRVEKAVVLITKLRQENADLEARLADVLRSAELLKNQKEELERQLAAQTRAANESSSRLEGLIARAKEAEEKAANAELKAAEAEERAAAMERKAQAAWPNGRSRPAAALVRRKARLSMTGSLSAKLHSGTAKENGSLKLGGRSLRVRQE